MTENVTDITQSLQAAIAGGRICSLNTQNKNIVVTGFSRVLRNPGDMPVHNDEVSKLFTLPTRPEAVIPGITPPSTPSLY